jgi:hypothetical protein
MSNGGTCKGCGGYTPRVTTLLCLDCKQKRKRERLQSCGICGAKFTRTGQAKYCPVHRGLSAEERVRLKEEFVA